MHPSKAVRIASPRAEPVPTPRAADASSSRIDVSDARPAASVVLNRTALGHYTFALGSNAEAVRLSGVNVDAWKIAVYGLGGAICGIAGILIASRLNSAQPALGQGYELEAIAAVVIGGTSLSGGTGTILGTIIGAFIMSVRKSTCSLEIGLQNGETHHDPRVVREPLYAHLDQTLASIS
jgi:ABC-type uncharacterized transport system permease subunit